MEQRNLEQYTSNLSVIPSIEFDTCESDSSSDHESRRRRLISFHWQLADAGRPLRDPASFSSDYQTLNSPTSSVSDDSEFSDSSSVSKDDSKMYRALATCLETISLRDRSEETSRPPKKPNSPELAFTKDAILRFHEDFGMWRTDLQVYRASAPSPEPLLDQQHPQDGERAPETLEYWRDSADTEQVVEFNSEGFTMTDSDEDETGRTITPTTQFDDAMYITSRTLSSQEDHGRSRRRRESSDSMNSPSSETAARRRKKKGKYRRERTGSSDAEEHWTRKTYRCNAPKKHDDAETRQKYIDKLVAGRFDGTHEEQVRINRILDQMENPDISDPSDDFLSDLSVEAGDLIVPFGGKHPITDNKAGDRLAGDPGPAPRSPVPEKVRSLSLGNLHDDEETCVWRGWEVARWADDDVLVDSDALFNNEDAAIETKLTDVDDNAVVMSAPDVAQGALALVALTQSLPVVSDEVHHTQQKDIQHPEKIQHTQDIQQGEDIQQPEDIQHPEKKVIPCTPMSRRPKGYDPYECIVNTVQVPSPGIKVWMDCLPDQKLLLETAFSDLHGLSRFHCEPIAHDPIRAYIESTTRPTMHLRINGEKRTSQVQDASEDYAVVRKLAETTGRERWWEFCIEDIHCAVCDKLIKDQRRRDCNRMTRLCSRTKGTIKRLHQHCMDSSCHVVCTHNRRSHQVFQKLKAATTQSIKYITLTSAYATCMDPNILVAATNVLKAYVGKLEGLEICLHSESKERREYAMCARISRQESRRFICAFLELEKLMLPRGRLRIRGLEGHEELEEMWREVSRGWWVGFERRDRTGRGSRRERRRAEKGKKNASGDGNSGE